MYINSGTWTWRADFSGAGKETWKDLFEHPERFTDDRLLSYVRIDYDEAGEPHGQLLAYEPSPPDEGPVDEVVEQVASLWERFCGLAARAVRLKVRSGTFRQGSNHGRTGSLVC